MEKFNNEEKYDMLQSYILAHKNSRNAANHYLELYPDRRQPHETLFRRLEVNLKTYGAFSKPKRNSKRLDEETQVIVLNQVRENPKVSTREIENNTGIPRTSAHRILKKHRYHPYKVHISQGLQPGDAERRTRFCHWYINQNNNNVTFLFNVLWSDESRFTNNGLFNRNNIHYWGTENPHALHEARHQERFGFNVWCGIIGRRIVGPIIFNNNLTSERYLNLLQGEIEDLLDDIPLNLTANMYFQQDGAPAHNAHIITNYLNNRFGNRWIGNRGPISWPARSPDLTAMDFFLWGYIKNKVYKTQFNNVEELQACVLREFHRINGRILEKVINSTLRRAQLCINNNGGLFEHLM